MLTVGQTNLTGRGGVKPRPLAACQCNSLLQYRVSAITKICHMHSCFLIGRNHRPAGPVNQSECSLQKEPWLQNYYSCTTTRFEWCVTRKIVNFSSTTNSMWKTIKNSQIDFKSIVIYCTIHHNVILTCSILYNVSLSQLAYKRELKIADIN